MEHYPFADKPVQDLWRLFRIMAEFTEGFQELGSVGPAVTIFGSARTGCPEQVLRHGRGNGLQARQGRALP